MRQKTLLSAALCLIMLLVCAGACAEIVKSGNCGENASWTLDDQGTLVISGTGDMTDIETYEEDGYDPILPYGRKIKKAVIGSGITSVGDFAFDSCTSLTEVTLPDSVVRIGFGAFSGCTGLKQVSIPPKVTQIDGSAFSGCTGLNEIKLPSGIKSIGAYTFRWCSGLTSIEIPSGVTSIGQEAFYQCKALEKVTLPSGLISIGKEAFAYCSKISSLTLPENLQTIGNEAFWGCSSLPGIHIPSGVTSIGRAAFAECTSLTSINIPSGVEKIQEQTCWRCSGLKSIIISEGVTSVDKWAFKETYADRISVPDSVTSIGDYGIPSYMTIYCHEYSYAESYAKINGNTVVLTDTYQIYNLSTLPDSLLVGNTVDASQHCFPSTPASAVWSSSRPEIASIDSKGVITALHGGETVISMTTGGRTCVTSLTVIQPAQSISFSREEYFMVAKTSMNLTAITEPSDAAYGLQWSTDQEIYVSVESSGKVTGNGIGTAVITAGDVHSGLSASCRVTVVYPVTGIALQADSTVLAPGETFQLQAAVTCRTTVLTNECVTFSTGNSQVASVDADGLITAVSAGTTVITVKAASGVSASFTVKVNAPSHIHSAVKDEAVAPTCTEPGLTEGRHCSSCGAVLEAQETVAPLGHTPVVTAAVEPTCTEPGTTESSVCRTCGAVLEAQQPLEPLGHDEVIDPGIPATLTTYGVTEGSHCSRCGIVLRAQEEIAPLVDTEQKIITIPDSVKAIGNNAFANSVTHVILISDTCTSIGSRAFAGCANLVLIRIPASVTEFGDDVFEGSSKVLIVTTEGSAAQQYAQEHHISYMIPAK